MTPDQPAWAVAVRSNLRLGYGVEDIALRLGCEADDVRSYVAVMRRHGTLAGLYRKPKAAAMRAAE